MLVRVTSTPIGATRTVADRQVSSASISNGGSGRFTTPIDEEQGDFVFNMEGMEDDDKKSEKRNSGGWTLPVPKTSALSSSGHKNGVGATTNGKRADSLFGTR